MTNEWTSLKKGQRRHQSERKSRQVDTSARKAWPIILASSPNLRLLVTPFGQRFSESLTRDLFPGF